MKHFLLILVLLLAVEMKATVPAGQFTHYSTEDGLPQYTIMDMLQDKKGFMWFATWDGLSKYDGFRFKNYKVGADKDYFIKSNRVQQIYEDNYGRIWFESYDGEIHCLNPYTENFWGPQLIPNFKDNTFQYSSIYISPRKNVWLLSNSDGCILVKDSIFNYEVLGLTEIKSRSVHAVYEEGSGKSWILTDNGISMKSTTSKEIQSFFFSNSNTAKKQAFYSAFELENEMLFGASEGKIWKYSKIDGKFNMLQTPVNDNILDIIPVSAYELMLTTTNSGFVIYNLISSGFEHFHPNTNTVLKSTRIAEHFLDKSGNVWFETSDEIGIYRFNVEKKQLKYYKVFVDDTGAQLLPPFSFVFEDINGRIWVQPKGGGFSIYNKVTETLEPFYNDPRSPNRKFSNIIHSAFSDRQGNLWMCTRSHGLEKVVFSQNYFHTETVSNAAQGETANDVRVVYEDSKKNIWVGTKDKKIHIYDSKRRLKGRLNTNGAIKNDGFWPGMLYSMLEDDKGNFWLGTKGEGLFKLSRMSDQDPFKVENFKNIPGNSGSLSENSVYSIFQDNKGQIWVGTYGGGINLIQTTKNGVISFINFQNGLDDYPINEASRVRYITQNAQGNICVGSTGGLVMFTAAFKKSEDIKCRLYSRIPGKTTSLSNNDVHGIHINPKGEMYLATFGGGINKVLEFDANGFPLSFKAYTTRDGLPSDVTLSILEDEQGKLWISNENNLSKFDPETESFERYNEIRAQMSVNSFSEASNCRLSSNELIFGYSGGLLSFFPAEIVNSNFKPYIGLTAFQLFNIEQEIGPDSPLKTHIDDVKKLVLSHEQNFFSIEYSALDFINPEHINYAYILEGFDNEWNYVQHLRKANYTNLPKGEYLFRLVSTNSEGVWCDNERQLLIIVQPSFWETQWAYLLYVLLLGGVVLIILKVTLSFYQLKNNVELEKKISEMKLRFFTDISHEIRTPLTMITAPVDFLMNDSKTPEHIRKQLNLIAQNTGRLLRLVNQILDFRKIQFMHLKVSDTELAPLIEDICSNFTEIAESRHIQFEFINEAPEARVWVDADCVDKMVMNLLSNAFKYTPEGRKITVKVFRDENYVSFEVCDEGPGLPKEKQKNLFTRFASFNMDKSKPSTGIGLSMVKELADKHGARIQVDSDDGKGTRIKISFLTGYEHFGKHVEIIAAQAEQETIEPFGCDPGIVDPTTGENEDSMNEMPCILIVEDDHDLRSFIRTILEEHYRVIEAENGQIAKAIALDEVPDIIVSDIMMPVMDGIELLQEIKKNIITSHIPLVLLSSKTTIESKLEGLAYGADDYITKPFSVSYFKARIANLISQRKHLQEIFRSQNVNHHYEPQAFAVTSQDEVLMENVVKVIEKNMENFEFSIDDMRAEVGMSRSAFFKKIKGLTGLAPVEFVRDIKLKRAAQLLSSGEYRVKEVTYMIGFSDSKYFAKCFKEKFGVTPMEYKQSEKSD